MANFYFLKDKLVNRKNIQKEKLLKLKIESCRSLSGNRMKQDGNKRNMYIDTLDSIIKQGKIEKPYVISIPVESLWCGKKISSLCTGGILIVRSWDRMLGAGCKRNNMGKKAEKQGCRLERTKKKEIVKSLHS